MIVERRSSLLPVATRSNGMGGVVISGVGVPFVPAYADIGPFIETVMPTAFADQEAARWQGDAAVEGRFQHQDSFMLASTRSGTMTLTRTADALLYTMQLPAGTEYVADLVQRRDVAGASMGFIVPMGGDAWSTIDGKPLRTINEALLVEISLVGNPAYTDATATVGRSRTVRAGAVLSGQNKTHVKNALSSLDDEDIPSAVSSLQAVLAAAGEHMPIGSDENPDPEDTLPTGGDAPNPEEDSVNRLVNLLMQALEKDSIPDALEKDSRRPSGMTVADGRRKLEGHVARADMQRKLAEMDRKTAEYERLIGPTVTVAEARRTVARYVAKMHDETTPRAQASYRHFDSQAGPRIVGVV